MEDWLLTRGLEGGSVLSIAQVWMLAQLWYGDRLSPEFRRPTMDEAHAIFERVGLTGRFWRLERKT